MEDLGDDLDRIDLDDAGDSDDEMPDDLDAARAELLKHLANHASDATPLETVDDKPIEAAEIDTIQERLRRDSREI